ncbi:DUF5788 family protein [Salarchaeum sp. JOR-1]|uniref:DUF5788 family protein n=1 Tax=Salarchaeum sp. JOR-1 TaxID=2599399 RepID=UPI001198A13E|nr:DUF5788 family protein [Salarchaeum sp. JOR-1]QDX39715.1 hypothetical protein FQU85_01945 [Salarchaeum sp. JOR-1]
MKPYERKQLLERVEREGATVGASIPDAIEVQGEPFELRSFVFEVKDAEAGERERVQEAKKLLRRERLERLERLEEGDISFAEGEELANAIVGLDRALNALESLGSRSVEQEMEVQERMDTKRWYSFLSEALGWDDDRGIRR